MGDNAFKTIILCINKMQNSEKLTLNLSENKLTNSSISYITEVFLNFKTEYTEE